MNHAAVIVCGDFNAKSSSWDPHCTTNENHHFTEKLILDYGLQVCNDSTVTRPNPDNARGGLS